MFTIMIVNSENQPFHIYATLDGLHPVAHILGGNSATTFKVFEGGRQLMPVHFGWSDMPGWVERFYYEQQTA